MENITRRQAIGRFTNLVFGATLLGATGCETLTHEIYHDFVPPLQPQTRIYPPGITVVETARGLDRFGVSHFICEGFNSAGTNSAPYFNQTYFPGIGKDTFVQGENICAAMLVGGRNAFWNLRIAGVHSNAGPLQSFERQLQTSSGSVFQGFFVDYKLPVGEALIEYQIDGQLFGKNKVKIQ